MQNDWQDEAHRRLGETRAISETAVINFMRTHLPAEVWDCGIDYDSRPCWRLSLVEIREEELEGLDRSGFRDLVRGKLQVVGDDLLKAWEERNVGG